MVEGRWMVDESTIVTVEQKLLIHEKLVNKITAEGFLLVKSQVERSQLGNKHLVVKKINHLIQQAIERKRSRIATKPSFQSKQKRIESKKITADKKANRRKPNLNF